MLKLSPCDYLFADLFGVYFFEDLLDRDTLQKSLDETVKLIPLLSSVVVKTPEGVRFKFVTPTNVQIVEKCDVEDDLHSMYCPDPITGILNLEEGMELNKFCDHVEYNFANVREPLLEKPLLNITLLHTTKKKSVLMVSANHCISDAHAFSHFLNAWGEGENRVIKNFTMSREGVKMTPGFDMYKCIRPEMDRLKECHTLKKVYEEEIGVIIRKGDECVTKIQHFPQKSLQDMKVVVVEYFKTKNQEVPRFSSNDCITAYLWTIHAAIYGTKFRSRNIALKMLVNVRPRFSKIDETFFGNATAVTNVDVQYDEIIKMSYPELVMKVRELVNGVDEQLCQTNINLAAYIAENELTYTMKNFHRKPSFTMNDWRLLDLLRPNFGGKCSRMVLYPPSHNMGLPSVATVLARDDKDGLNVLCTFENPVYEKIKDLDISGNLDSLEKIKGMEFEILEL